MEYGTWVSSRRLFLSAILVNFLDLETESADGECNVPIIANTSRPSYFGNIG
jgi:hypothetical protein